MMILQCRIGRAKLCVYWPLRIILVGGSSGAGCPVRAKLCPARADNELAPLTQRTDKTFVYVEH